MYINPKQKHCWTILNWYVWSLLFQDTLVSNERGYDSFVVQFFQDGPDAFDSDDPEEAEGCMPPSVPLVEVPDDSQPVPPTELDSLPLSEPARPAAAGSVDSGSSGSAG